MEVEQPDPEIEPDRLERALALAHRYLNRRDRTVAEMRRHLEARGCGTAEIDHAIAALAEQGYLDDARYARLFAEDKRLLDQWGSDRIARTLASRGIDRELIAQAVGGARSHASEVDRALALLRRRFPAVPRDRRERERALGVLLRKGYDSEVALDAIAAYADCADPSPVLRCP